MMKCEAVKGGITGCSFENIEGKYGKLFDLDVAMKAGSDVFMNWSDPQTEGDVTVRNAKALGFALEQKLTARGNMVEVDLTIKPEGRSVLNYCLLHFDFMPGTRPLPPTVQLDDCRVPHLLYRPDIVIAEMVFRSPALVVRKAGQAMALIPDLDRLRETSPVPWVMDFDRAGPRGTTRLSVGLMKYKPYRHTYFKKLPGEFFDIPESGVTVSGIVIVSTEAEEDFSHKVQHFIWEKYGVPNYKAVGPQVMLLDQASEAAMARIFKRDDLYSEFNNEGKKCGGVIAFTATTEKKMKPTGKIMTGLTSLFNGLGLHFLFTMFSMLGMSEKYDDRMRRLIHKRGIPFIPQTWFQSWFNNLRTAYGARIMAERWGDGRLKDQAERIKNLALTAPAEGGIFSAIAFHPEGNVSWKRGSLTFWAINDYHTPDAATTGYYMLRWYRDIEQDRALLEKAKALGEFFFKAQLDSGAIPAWVKGKSLKPHKRLMETASTAGPMMFMAMLASVDNDEKILDAARRMARFIEEKVLPEHKWFDYETFYSCSRKFGEVKDPRTGINPQNCMSMLWAAEGLRLLYEMTKYDKYLEMLGRCLDDLLWAQQVWNPPFLSINPYGGFASMNTDAEWNDARQGIIAPVLMDSYLTTGDRHLFQRGVAAVRAGFTTMLHPDMMEVAPGNMRYYRESDKGAVYENYAHVGYDRPTAGYQEPDWGAGTAVFAAAHALKFYGDLFVDLSTGNAFGINGCNVEKYDHNGNTLSLEVNQVVPGIPHLKVVVHGADPNLKIKINGIDTPYESR